MGDCDKFLVGRGMAWRSDEGSFGTTKQNKNKNVMSFILIQQKNDERNGEK